MSHWSQVITAEHAIQQVKALLAAPEHSYGLIVIDWPQPEIHVRTRPWYALDCSSLPATIGPYRIIVEDEQPAEALHR